ncbi:hypothetical protein [Micromonospora sp. NBRC 101691]|uniref:hypothetical protein n=1 Tax=Micromonospora sp. NBRC 101691 TaxID=3032198 RepID=UPI0025565DE0|nr:hypothetical protein [Micromonospora sp. NBRC 101691]
MATNKLGKVVAGAALGGASLLVFTPGIAFADNGGGHDDHHKGKVYADPYAVRPGHEVKLIEVCAERQEHAYVWSKVTGKVKLHPRDHHKKDHDWQGEESESGEKGHGSKKDHDSKKGHDSKKDHDWGKDGDSGSGNDWGNGSDSGNGNDWGNGSDSGSGWGNGNNSGNGNSWGNGNNAPGNTAENGTNAPGATAPGTTAPGTTAPGTTAPGNTAPGNTAPGTTSENRQQSDETGQPGMNDGGWGAGDEVKDEAKKKADEEAAKKKADEEAARKKAEAEATAEEEKAREDRGSEEESEEGAKDRGPRFVYYGEAEIPWDAEPGKYELKGSCGEGTLIVLPKGHVKGGDGGATGTDREATVGGAAMLGAAALGGIVLMRRRRTDASLV